MKIKRFKNNPVITPEMLTPSQKGFEVVCALNPGAFTYKGRIGLVIRTAERPIKKKGKLSTLIMNMETKKMEPFSVSEKDPKLTANEARCFVYDGRLYLTTLSHLLIAWSDDGGKTFVPDYKHRIFPENEYETFGVEDCRVTEIDGTYYLTYTAASDLSVGIGMTTTKDWKHFTKHKVIIPAKNKDCAIFPRKINGKYYMFHRPILDSGRCNMWICESKDLEHWGNHQCVIRCRKDHFDCERLGAGAAPIEVPEGWLEVYHGADDTGKYCLGLLLLDKKEPWKVLARSEKPFMCPSEDYELNGFYGNCIFVNGQVVDGDKLTIYYGASDTVVCGAELSIKELMKTLKKS